MTHHAPTPRVNDHAGLVFLLDCAGRTIEQLEQRVDHLTAQVSVLVLEREELRRLIAVARTDADDRAEERAQADEVAATDEVPHTGRPDAENGGHDLRPSDPPGEQPPA